MEGFVVVFAKLIDIHRAAIMIASALTKLLHILITGFVIHIGQVHHFVILDLNPRSQQFFILIIVKVDCLFLFSGTNIARNEHLEVFGKSLIRTHSSKFLFFIVLKL